MDFIQYPCLGQVGDSAKIRSITESVGQVTIYLQTFDNCDNEFAVLGRTNRWYNIMYLFLLI